jgi:hypothetical protein
MKLLLKILVISLFLGFVSIANAQLQTPIDGVTLQTNLSYPRPGQDVEIYIESFSFDLNSSSIIWSTEGKTIGQGVGLTKILVTAPKLGVKLPVIVRIKGADGREVQKSITLQTSSIDIIWESLGYAPPFYKGKLPFSYQNSIKVSAIPHFSSDGIKEVDPKTLVYSWKLGGKYINNGQGYNKQSIEIPPTELPQDLEVSVDISSRDSILHNSASINLTPTEPTLSFYEDNALYGVLFNKSLKGQVELKNTEMKVLAIPFGFNLKNKDISYAWSINNVDQPSLIKNRSITIRTKGDSDGRSNIDLDIRNQDDILQSAREGFTVYFNKKQQQNVTF